jgi:hypothetical protein
MSHFGPLIKTYVGTCNRRQSDGSVEMSFERSVEMSRTLTSVVWQRSTDSAPECLLPTEPFCRSSYSGNDCELKKTKTKFF